MTSVPSPRIRPATGSDAHAVARIWWAGWQDGHLGGVPEALIAVRTKGSFDRRARERVEDTTVAEIGGDVVGFVMIVGDEVEQVYVDAAHRGSGIAAMLLDEAERQVALNGHGRAWLAVVATNERARAFYGKRGWRDDGGFEYQAEGDDEPIPVPCRRYVKDLGSKSGV